MVHGEADAAGSSMSMWLQHSHWPDITRLSPYERMWLMLRLTEAVGVVTLKNRR
jgi:hypothetical protein